MFASGICEYLGHAVGNGTVRPMDCKVASVRDFNVPQTKKDVRYFLGLCGYYRKFMPNFPIMATPLDVRSFLGLCVYYRKLCQTSQPWSPP